MTIRAFKPALLPSSPNTARTRRATASASIFAILLVAGGGLRLQGRLWTCACGEVYLWAGDIWSRHNSQHLLDPYTLTHVLHGVLLAWGLGLATPRLWSAWQLTLAVFIESAWELFENSTLIIERYRTATISLGYAGDTLLNSFGDILACAVGFALARFLGGWRAATLFALIEILLLIWIRDSLLLNVLMLLYSPEGLRAWQMGG